jgi:hypothetical protein
VTQPFLERFCSAGKASHSPGSESCAGRPDMTFLDFWSTSSALYEGDEGPKDAGAAPASFWPSSTSYRAIEVDQKSRKVISGLPAQDSLPGLWEAFSLGAAETLQKRLCHASDTPQKPSGSRPHLHLYAFSHRGEFHGQ